MSERGGLGRRGEGWAADFLEKRGYRILGRNIRLRIGEIDLVAEQDGCTVLVEVKTYRPGFMEPEEAVGRNKQLRIAALGASYLKSKGKPDAEWRADVVAIEVGADGAPSRIEHYVNAIEEW